MKSCALIDPAGYVVARWAGDWAPASLAAIPNRNVTTPFRLSIDGAPGFFLPAGPLADVINARLHGSRVMWERNPWAQANGYLLGRIEPVDIGAVDSELSP